jgi:hypothetical protein
MEHKFFSSRVYLPGYSREEAIGSVGAGWTPLVNRIFDALVEFGHPVKVIQVKEKFGGLRVYTSTIHDELDKIIYDACVESLTICEVCGAPGELYGSSWYFTRCERHADGRRPLREFTSEVSGSDYDEEC